MPDFELLAAAFSFADTCINANNLTLTPSSVEVGGFRTRGLLFAETTGMAII